MNEAKHVYWMQYQITADGKPRAFSFAVESAHPSLASLAAALNKGVVAVERLFLVQDGRGGSFIRTRTPYMLGREGLVVAQNYHRQCGSPRNDAASAIRQPRLRDPGGDRSSPPPAMKVDGILILRELGLSSAEIERLTGICPADARKLFAGLKPFRHQSEYPMGGSNVEE